MDHSCFERGGPPAVAAAPDLPRQVAVGLLDGPGGSHPATEVGHDAEVEWGPEAGPSG